MIKSLIIHYVDDAVEKKAHSNTIAGTTFLNTNEQYLCKLKYPLAQKLYPLKTNAHTHTCAQRSEKEYSLQRCW